ncbi:hybrid sensor histidine kinase/response regulator transcription factor [Flavivirga rizhaonensis]|uniref:histidine kinase n=1 Tax=Flavivirga rizhaonensis TaxID=2559571 RepID=A0A4S1DWR3_9FLAO|nr:hybrid sensor histidine kinase/response regulator transcription factor [Flavivirga rizhaonensis]TGV02586.1 hybrid sensor histidine kinase/response regulator [Flavivirga rizhaonensis]
MKQLYYTIKKVILTLIFGLLLPWLSISQVDNLKFEHFIDDKGLTQNTILDLLQDSDGYVWIGTANGLYKYDGKRFTIYRNIPKEPNSVINNVINKLKFDNHDNLWIGTGRGLCKFNIKTQTFSNTHNSLSDKEITAIYNDINGTIWVGTRKSGLYHLIEPNTANEKIEHYFYQPNQLDAINDNEILSIVEDRNSSLWIGTGKGLNILYKSNESTKGFINVETVKKAVNSLLIDKKGNLWIGESGTGLLYIEQPKNIRTLKFENIKKFSLGFENNYQHLGNVNAIKEDASGKLWIGVYGYGLYCFNPDNGSSKLYAPNDMSNTSLSNSRIMSILLDKTNVLWVGTKVGGLNKCDLERKDILFFTKDVLIENSLTNASINAILEDENNLVWVGTENGFNQIKFDEEDYKSLLIKHYFFKGNEEVSELVIQQPIRSILKDSDNDYWLGGDGITHMRFNPINGQVTFKPTDINLSEVFSIVEDTLGNIWFGSFAQGLIKWKKKKNPDGKTFDFSNLTYYKPDINDKNSISDNLVSCLYKDRKNNIWVGTLQGGINLVVPGKSGEEDTFISFKNDPKNSNSLSHNSVFSIHEGKNGVYWIGTFGGGLNQMILPPSSDATPEFINYTEQDGLANNAVYGILESDDGQLWMSTDNGISCFNINTKTFKNYNKEDGLQSNNFRKNAFFKNKEGYLFFGGLKGLNIFHPDNLKENTFPATAKITGFKIKNEDVNVGQDYNGRILLEKSMPFLTKPLKLKYHENTLTFEFTALHFASPEKNRFKYKLEGFDKSWVESKGLPFAHYTNLSYGSYSFKVIASNNDGVWNETPSTIEFVITPPFWLSGWALLIYGLLLIGIIFSIKSYYQLQSKERIAVKGQKELEAVNKLKLQFFTNISHDFKTPITLILNPIEEILESKNINDSLKPKLKIIERNANSLLRLVNQLMEFRKIEVGETKLGATKTNIINFVREITFSFRALAKEKNIALSFESQLYATDVWFDWDKLEKILNNLIFNAIKFSNKEGYVIVRVSKPKDKLKIRIKENNIVSDYIKIEIEDNGIGIEESELPYVFQRFYQVNSSYESQKSGSGIGLAITKDLVDLHHGEIEVQSEIGKGSCFILKFPLGNEHLLPEELMEVSAPELLTETQMDEGFNFNENIENINSSKSKDSILVVDDNNDIRELIRNKFEQNYQIFEADNGKEALNIALKQIPDLIISDVLMPGMDGIEFCDEIKNNIRTSHIPVILLTALNSVEHRIEGLKSGADAYIPKPFKMKLLIARVENLIKSVELMRRSFLTEKEFTPEKVSLGSVDEAFLKKIMSLMEKNMSNQVYWVDELAFDMNTSRSTFFRKLKKLTGQSPNDFIRLIRLKRATQLLQENQLTIAQISYKVGFKDPNYFSKCFRKVFREAPSRYSNKPLKNIIEDKM